MAEAQITRAHGSGGLYTHRLISNLFRQVFSNSILDALLDSAIIDSHQGKIAFTTDSHVVKPIFFPNDNIGSLAVNGTINDLAVCGATPLFLSCALIIEEGFSYADLEKIIESMQAAAQAAGVQIVTGDTKVVGHGEADGIFINTSGIGVINRNINLRPECLASGDKIIVSGFLGEHEAAIIQARLNLPVETNIASDCAALNSLIAPLLENELNLKLMRDPTRGGLATTLNEFVHAQNVGIIITENCIPIRDTVRGLCEPLGFDPLYLASEGKVVIVVGPEDAEKALSILKSHPLGKDAAIVGEITSDPPGKVLLKTQIGTYRLLDMLTGEMLPRIC